MVKKKPNYYLLTCLCFRFISGIFFDLPAVKPHRRLVFNLSLLLSGLSHIVLGYGASYEVLVVGAVLHGVVTSTVVSCRAVMVVDLLGIENLPSGLGMTVFVQGIGVFIGPLIAGRL